MAVSRIGSRRDAYLLRRAIFMPWELPRLMDPDMARDGWLEVEEGSFHRRQVDRLKTPRTKVAALESTWYMRNQLLRDSDWAGMAHSLEIQCKPSAKFARLASTSLQ